MALNDASLANEIYALLESNLKGKAPDSEDHFEWNWTQVSKSIAAAVVDHIKNNAEFSFTIVPDSSIKSTVDPSTFTGVVITPISVDGVKNLTKIY